jgi:hypothetical protein
MLTLDKCYLLVGTMYANGILIFAADKRQDYLPTEHSGNLIYNQTVA